jgi:hydroxymethylpyrimidine pyrophosphatase-like HAD family hydrolase
MKFLLVAIDLDGTTLNSDHELTEYTLNTLRKLGSKGIKIAIATGRSITAVTKIIRALNLSQSEIPIVCYNGALGAICRKDGSDPSSYSTEVLFLNPLSGDYASKVLELATKEGCVAQVSSTIHIFLHTFTSFTWFLLSVYLLFVIFFLHISSLLFCFF